FNEGVTTVIETATSGFCSATASFVVVVNDITPPIISGCPSNISQTTNNCTGAVVTFTSPTSTDNCSNNFTSGSQTFNYTGNIVNYTVPLGLTTITVNAKGAQGGQSTGGL